MLDRDEKIELHNQVREIEQLVEAMNGPFMETGQILKQLSALREAWLDDEIERCEFCGSEHLLSEDALILTEDGRACEGCTEPVEDTP
ncbi:MAG: hypothetical protein GYB53_15405 [Rhodobacteraceae bacterium]|nr:hypothetical protein [Paracoccaceae bacterium]MBR9820177.1 hypothetical protein [Paracoccaceae bacterium]